MPRSIADLRKAAGGLDGLTDEQIVKASYPDFQKYYGTEDEYAKAIGYGGAGRGLTMSRLSAGVDSYQGQLYGAAESLARSAGMDGVADAAGRGRKTNKDAADYANARAKEQGGIDDWRDVRGIPSALNFAGGLAAQSLPQMAAQATGGFLGGLVGGVPGAIAGGAAVGYGNAFADITDNQGEQTENQPGGRRTDPMSAALYAGPYAAVDAFTGIGGKVMGLTKKFARGASAVEAPVAKEGINFLERGLNNLVDTKGVAARIAYSGAKTGLVEGAGETFQEVMNQGGRMAVDPNAGFLSDDAQKRYVDSFVGGGVLGGLLGGAGNRGRRFGIQPPAAAPSSDLQAANPGTSLGFEDLLKTRTETVGPLGDLTPDFTTSRGFEDLQRRDGMDASGLYPAVGEAPLVPQGLGLVPRADRLTQTEVPGLNPNPDVMGVDFTGNVAGTDAQNNLMNDPGAVEARRQQMERQQRAQGIKDESDRVAAEIESRNQRAAVMGLDPKKKVVMELFDQLEAAHYAGTIDDVGMGQSIGQLKVNESGKVRKMFKDIEKAATDKTANDAAVKAAVDKGAAADAQTAQTNLAALLPKATDATPATAAPASSDNGPAAQPKPAAAVAVVDPSSSAGRVAAMTINPNATTEVGRSKRKVSVTPAQLLDKMDAATPQEAFLVRAVLGMDQEGHVVGSPLTYEEAAIAEARLLGKTLTGPDLKKARSRVQQTLAKFGIDRGVIDLFAGTTAESVDVGEFTSGDGEVGTFGTRIESSASKATGEGKLEGGGTSIGGITQDLVPTKADFAIANAWQKRIDAKTTTIEIALADPAFKSPRRKAAMLQVAASALDAAPKARERLEARLAPILADTPAALKLGDPTQVDKEKAQLERNRAVAEQEAVNEFRVVLTSPVAKVAIAEWDKDRAGTPLASSNLRVNTLADMVVYFKTANETHEGDTAKVDAALKEYESELLENDFKQPANEFQAGVGVNDAAGARGVRAIGSDTGNAAGKASQGRANAERSDAPDSRGASDAKQLTSEFAKFLRVGALGRMVTVVQSVNDLPFAPGLAQSVGINAQTQGFVMDGKAYFIADNIAPGKGKAVFMHEVGSHLGLQGMLTQGEFKNLVGTVLNWAGGKAGPEAQKIARAAMARVKSAKTSAAQYNTELVAYAVEEATLAGYNPSAAGNEGPIKAWMRSVIQQVKNILTKLGVNPDKFGVQDLVDLAYGAARAVHSMDVQENSGKTEQSMKPWHERESNYIDGREYTLRDLHNRLGEAYDETDSVDGAFKKAMADSSPKQQSVLRALMADDLLGYDYPHQAIRAIMEEPGSYDMSPRLKAAVSRMGNSSVQFSKVAETPREAAINTSHAAVQSAFKDAWATAGDLGSSFLKKAAFTSDLVNMAANNGLNTAHAYLKAMNAVQTEKVKLVQEVQDVVEDFGKLTPDEQGQGPLSVNLYLRDSTMAKAWGHVPEWKPTAKVDAAMGARYTALSPRAQALVDRVFKHGENVRTHLKNAADATVKREFGDAIKAAEAAKRPEQVVKLKADQELALKDSGKGLAGDWPYAPLGRFGDHVVLAMSARYLQAVKDGNKKLIDELQTDAKHYQVERTDTMRSARVLAESLQTNFPGGHVTSFEKGPENSLVYGGRDALGALTRLRHLVKDSASDDLKLDAQANNAIDKSLRDLHLQLLSETSARKSGLGRANIAGANKDMMRTFAGQGQAMAHYIATLRMGADVQDQLQAMKDQAEERTPGDTQRRAYYNELLKRHVMNLEYKPNKAVEAGMAMSSIWTLLTNPAHHLTNGLQTVMSTLPQMAGKHGYRKSAAALTTAYHDLGSIIKGRSFTEADFGKLPKDVQAMAKALADRGSIGVDQGLELGQFESTPDGKLHVFTTVVEKLRGMAEGVEAVNRLSAAMAAYRLEISAGATPQAAIEYAHKTVLETHGDYSGFNAPRIMRNGVGRLLTQFKKYQLIQLSLYAKLGHQAFNGASPEERAVAYKTLAFNLAHLAAIGGMTGLPGFALVAWVLGKAFGDKDEPEGAEAKLRKMIGDKHLADLLLHGAPKFAGVDLSTRLGGGDLLTPLPYSEPGLNRKGYESVLLGLSGPLLGGLLPRFADGLGQMSKSIETGRGEDFFKGLEQLVPNGLGNTMKALRYQANGLTQRNGDTVIQPEDLSVLTSMSQALGLPSNAITDKNFLAGQMRTSGEFYKQRSQSIKQAYVNAQENNNADGMKESRTDWMRMQGVLREQGFTTQPLSVLLKAPSEKRKREASAVSGVETTKRTRGAVELLTE